MPLSSELVSQFAKLASNKPKEEKRIYSLWHHCDSKWE